MKADPITFTVSVNTNAITGTNGFLNFQFNPGGAGAQSATASIFSFSLTGGTPAGTADRSGGVAGTLPQTVTINNSGQLNELFQGFTIGNSFSFSFTLSGSALDTPGGNIGSVFTLSLFGANGTTPLLTTDPNGTASLCCSTRTGASQFLLSRRASAGCQLFRSRNKRQKFPGWR